jgi:hypothetical protein
VRDVAAAKETTMPLTFGRVLWAVFFANVLSAIIIGIGYAIITSK